MNSTQTILRLSFRNRRQLSPLLASNTAVVDRACQHEARQLAARCLSSSGKSGDDDKDDTALIVSQFKNQIVHQLWTERAKAKKDTSRKALGGPSTCPSLNQAGKTPCQSETKVEYPFSTQELLAESYKSPWNCKFFACTMMSILPSLSRC